MARQTTKNEAPEFTAFGPTRLRGVPAAGRGGVGMTEIDTNEIRDKYVLDVPCDSDCAEGCEMSDMKALCDALDAARAERDAYRKAKQENDERFQLEAGARRERAEKAEATIERVRKLLGVEGPHFDAYADMRWRHVLSVIVSALDGEVS